jgi:hypothetical protein
MDTFKSFLGKHFSHKEREDATPERTKILRQMTPGENKPFPGVIDKSKKPKDEFE